MRTTIKALCFVCLYCVLTASQCQKDKEPLSQLPPETQEGKNTFGCLVNGEVFVPRGNGGIGVVTACYYQYIYPSPTGFVFHVSSVDKSISPLKSIYINIDSIKVEEGKRYVLLDGRKGAAQGGFSNSLSYLKEYLTNDSSSGEIFFKKFDESNQIAAGTFWFTAVNSFGEIIKVTEGRFDMKFTL